MRSPFSSAFALLLALFAAGCGGKEETSPLPAQTHEIAAGDVTILADSNGLTFSRGTTPLLKLPAEAFEWGTVPAVEDANYDPYRIYVPHPLYEDPEITWAHPDRLEVTEATDKSLAISLEYPDGVKGTVTFEAQAAGRFTALWKPVDDKTSIAYFRLRPRASADEGFYGLGEYYDEVNHRGKVRAMQLEIDSGVESGYNEAHVPVPFMTGTNGWGLFIESERPGAFAVATTEPDLIEAAFGTGLASAEGLRFHLFGAAHPLDVTRLYYDVTGNPRLPARWALGPWIWRDENKDQAEFLADVNTIRDLDLATTAMWIDRPYATAVNTFDFLGSQFPEPQAMIDEAHGLGFRLALWHTPYLDEKGQADDTKDLREYAEAHGYYPASVGLLLNKWGRPIDLTNPDAYAWWQSLVKKYTAMGIEGFKLDYTEDVVPGLTIARNEWDFASGEDERTLHAGFQRYYHRLYSETLPAEGGFLLCRGGTFGDQTNVSVIWPGDLDATFLKHREKGEDSGGSFFGVGGLPASIIAGLSLGPSGFPFYGADTGGYKHSPPDKELFTRWFEQTAFSTVMQIGTSSNTVAWEKDGGPGFDDEMLDWYRLYTRLHLRLFPYLWTYAKNQEKDGRPIARPLGLAYPELGIHPNDVYLLGDNLLVAPVTTRGATSREVPFPPGKWVDYWTGETHAGGSSESVAAPLGRIPVFVREGGIVPMLRPTIDAMAETTDPDRVDSYATTPGVLYVRAFAGPAADFTVFDGAEIHAERNGGKLSLSITDGAELKNGTMFEAIAVGAAPTGVKDGGSALAPAASLDELTSSAAGWFYDAAVAGTLYVRVGPGSHTIEATFSQ
jgi:alpha-D-xyloside xylohydrolase